ncbi:MAG TPA: VIT domain-containing protein [Pirellulaceae bacterium]|nr:VIT domain-containing protein [Pirellulaceae bacterium]
MKRIFTMWMAGLFCLIASQAWAQGVLVIVDHPHPVPLPRPIIIVRPSPPETPTYKIKEIGVQTRITDQVARVQVTQSFVNTGSRQMEVSFVFPLPYEGAIDRLTFMVDGKEIDGKLLPAKEARSIYEGYVRKNQDPALLEYMGTGMFKTSVFPVPPGAERKVSLRFSQLLKKNHQLTDFLYPLATAKYTSQPVEAVNIEVAIESKDEIKSVYSPTHLVKVERPTKTTAVVKYEGKNEIPQSDFRLFYDTNKGELGTSVLSYKPKKDDDGYFLMLASPEIKAADEKRPAKTVIIVLDRSGSMSGKKIEQAKGALKFVVNNLREGDMFNIVSYDSNVESFKPELQRFDDETRKSALGFVEGQYPGGSTNIDGALKTALAMVKDDSRPNFVLFLTDGLPTAGETNESKIVANIKDSNKLNTRIINLGVGYDVNSRLLDRLSNDNSGRSEYVRPNEDIEAHVSRVYAKISAPALTNVALKFDIEGAKTEDGSAFNRMYPKKVHDIFEGEQLVIVGRYKKAGAARVTVTGKVGSQEHKLDFPAPLVEASGDESYAFVEKLWAMRRIGEIIDDLDLKGKNDELINELVALSTKHGILTPYTSFLADENAKSGDLADTRSNFNRASGYIDRLSAAEGQAGVAQRAEKRVWREANQAAAPAADGVRLAEAVKKAEASGRSAGGGFGGLNTYRDIDTDKEVATDTVQQIGNESLYRRGKLWIATNAKDIDPEKDSAKIKTIERFSDEYFKLVEANSANENAVLARQQSGEELLIKLRGQAYRIH